MCCKSGTVNAQLSISLARARVEVMMPPARSSGPVRTQCGSELAALDPVVLQAKGWSMGGHEFKVPSEEIGPAPARAHLSPYCPVRFS